MKNKRFILLPISFLLILGCPSKGSSPQTTEPVKDEKVVIAAKQDAEAAKVAAQNAKELEEQSKVAATSGDSKEAERLAQAAKEQADLAEKEAKEAEARLAEEKKKLEEKSAEKVKKGIEIANLNVEVETEREQEKEKYARLKEILRGTGIIKQIVPTKADLEAKLANLEEVVIKIEKLKDLKIIEDQFVELIKFKESIQPTNGTPSKPVKESPAKTARFDSAKLKQIVGPIDLKIDKMKQEIGEEANAFLIQLLEKLNNLKAKLFFQTPESMIKNFFLNNYFPAANAAFGKVKAELVLLTDKQNTFNKAMGEKEEVFRLVGELDDISTKRTLFAAKKEAQTVLEKEISDINATIPELERLAHEARVSADSAKKAIKA